MKAILITSLCLLQIRLCIAQVVFCPPGAEWHYNFAFYTINPQTGFIKTSLNEAIKYVRDSTLSSVTCKVLRHNYFFKGSCDASQTPLSLIKQTGDTVFVRNSRTHHKWQILYNFAAQAGDSWTDSLYSNSNTLKVFSFHVDSVSTVIVNGFTLKQLYSYPYTITERIGANSFLFNFNTSSCDGIDYDRFLCYQDSTFGLKQFTSYPCNYSNPLGIKELKSDALEIKIFPNPAKEWLDLKEESLTGGEKISIVDVFGREVRKTELSPSLRIDLKDLSEGIYFLILTRNQEVMCSRKFIKE